MTVVPVRFELPLGGHVFEAQPAPRAGTSSSSWPAAALVWARFLGTHLLFAGLALGLALMCFALSRATTAEAAEPPLSGLTGSVVRVTNPVITPVTTTLGISTAPSSPNQRTAPATVSHTTAPVTTSGAAGRTVGAGSAPAGGMVGTATTTVNATVGTATTTVNGTVGTVTTTVNGTVGTVTTTVTERSAQ